MYVKIGRFPGKVAGVGKEMDYIGRVYTQSHVDCIVEVLEEAFRRRESL